MKMKLLDSQLKNNVLEAMERLLDQNRESLLAANQRDLDAFDREDRALYDRLVVDHRKIDQMIQALGEVRMQEDPVNREISTKNLDNGLRVINRTAPFGTIMIIYESRPDVTVEAASLAFKANNKILLKGGKEAAHSNRELVDLWHRALETHGLDADHIQLLEMDRTRTQAFLKDPDQPLDLIVPRGGERLIDFVKQHAKCAVLISGRGNNFLYVHPKADWQKSLEVILNAKTDKISACNALDKILVDSRIEGYGEKLRELHQVLTENKVSIQVDPEVKKVLPEAEEIPNEDVWEEEFLAMRCLIGSVDSLDTSIAMINRHSGGHSSTIMTQDDSTAQTFMENVDCAAVYQNASTRFTDGGQMGVGAELAISTDKLHHRGPLGLKELVTNKYYIFGDGQIRK